VVLLRCEGVDLLGRHVDAPRRQEADYAIGARPAIDEAPVVLVPERLVVLPRPGRTCRQESIEQPLPRRLVQGCGISDDSVQIHDDSVKVRAGERDHRVHRHLHARSRPSGDEGFF